jgi:hypothetical protein
VGTGLEDDSHGNWSSQGSHGTLFLDCFLCFRLCFYSFVFQLFLAGPIGLGPGVSGILGYTSLFHVFLDVG